MAICFCAKGVRARAVEGGLEGEKVMRQEMGGMMKALSEKRTVTGHAAVVLKAKKSTMTCVDFTFRLLRPLHRLLFLLFHLFSLL